MNVGCISSKKYLKFVKTLVCSIISNNDDYVRLFVVSNEITFDDLGILKDYSDRVSLSLIKPTEEILKGIRENGHYGIYTYFRPFIYKYLPDDVDRILLLDLDLVVDGRLEEFYSVDLEGNFMAGSQDGPLNIKDGFKAEFIDKYHLDPNKPLINAGVLLLDVKKIKEYDPYESILNLLSNDRDILKYADQDIINYIFYNKIKIVNHKFNYMINHKEKEYAVSEPVIVHYASTQKPFSFKYNGALSEIFWKYHKKHHKFEYLKYCVLHPAYKVYIEIKNLFKGGKK